jgi:hypothetical protein
VTHLRTNELTDAALQCRRRNRDTSSLNDILASTKHVDYILIVDQSKITSLEPTPAIILVEAIFVNVTSIVSHDRPATSMDLADLSPPRDHVVVIVPYANTAASVHFAQWSYLAIIGYLIDAYAIKWPTEQTTTLCLCATGLTSVHRLWSVQENSVRHLPSREPQQDALQEMSHSY